MNQHKCSLSLAAHQRRSRYSGFALVNLMTETKMQEPINYFIDQSNGTVDLTLTRERFIAKTQGKGLIDKPRTIDIALSDLKYFCLVPTIAFQNLVSYTSVGDHSYDAEFIFSY